VCHFKGEVGAMLPFYLKKKRANKNKKGKI
jgi:hypothetical protein